MLSPSIRLQKSRDFELMPMVAILLTSYNYPASLLSLFNRYSSCENNMTYPTPPPTNRKANKFMEPANKLTYYEDLYGQRNEDEELEGGLMSAKTKQIVKKMVDNPRRVMTILAFSENTLVRCVEGSSFGLVAIVLER